MKGNLKSAEELQPTARKRLLNVEETARYLGISPRTIYNRIARRSTRPFPVRAKRVGRSVRFDVRDLDFYINTL